MTPVILSLVMAALFRSPLALVMGVLGPAMVLGSWWESRRSHQKQHDREWETFTRDTDRFESARQTARALAQAEAGRLHPPLLSQMRDPFWRDGAESPSGARLGTGWWVPPPGHPLEGEESIPGMPGVVESQRGIALVGPEDAVALWRLILAHWVVRATPEQRTVLPPEVRRGGELPRSFRGPSLAVWASRLDHVPAECGIVVVPHGLRHLDVRDSSGITRKLLAEGLTQAEFSWIAKKLLPASSDLATVSRVDYSRRDRLYVEVGDSTPWDLVAEGPHAVVWGATGSGKSVTLSSLVLSLARRYSPRQLIVVIVDFKGGAGLSLLGRLPHVVGSVTDLDTARASRALAGLAREMVARERLLAEHGVDDISRLPHDVMCPRLVVAVDEAAWLLETFPAWSATLADLVARGRSLGIHVMIATQRIQGVLGPAVMANIALRVCGRISDDSEVTAWIPGLSSRRAEPLRNALPGVAIAVGAHRPPTDVTVMPGSVQHVPSGESASWRVWTEELPATVSRKAHAWCLLDDHEARVHRFLSYDPKTAGSVVVVGDRGSGKSSALAALALGCENFAVLDSEPFVAWLQLTAAEPQQVCIMDNADELFNRAGPEGVQVLWDQLEDRAAPVLLSAKAESPQLRSLGRFAAQSVVLSIAKAEASLVWGGWGTSIEGRGHYGQAPIQIVSGAALPAVESVPAEPAGAMSLAPIVLTQDLSGWQGTEVSWLGRPEDLLSQWSTLSPILYETPVLCDGISAREVQHATSGRVNIPALPVPEGMVVGSWKGKVFLTRLERWQH